MKNIKQLTLLFSLSVLLFACSIQLKPNYDYSSPIHKNEVQKILSDTISDVKDGMSSFYDFNKDSNEKNSSMFLFRFTFDPKYKDFFKLDVSKDNYLDANNSITRYYFSCNIHYKK